MDNKKTDTVGLKPGVFSWAVTKFPSATTWKASHIHNETIALEEVTGKRQNKKVSQLLLAAFSQMFLERYATKFKKNWRQSGDVKPLRIGKATVLDSPLESAQYGGRKKLNKNFSVKIK